MSLRTFNEHTGPVRCVATFPDGRFISGSSDTTIRLWNRNDEKSIRTFKGEHIYAVSCLAIFPDSENFISGSLDGMI